MFLAAIDQQLKESAIAVGYTDLRTKSLYCPLYVKTVETKKLIADTRRTTGLDEHKEKFHWDEKIYAVLEGVYVRQNYRIAIQLGKNFGRIEEALRRSGFTVIEAPVFAKKGTVRKGLTIKKGQLAWMQKMFGMGLARVQNKDLAMRLAKDSLPFSFIHNRRLTQDEADAVCMWLWGLDRLKQEELQNIGGK